MADETNHAVSEPIAEPASEVAAEPVEQASAEGETADGLLSELFDGSYTMLLAGGGAALINAHAVRKNLFSKKKQGLASTTRLTTA